MANGSDTSQEPVSYDQIANQFGLALAGYISWDKFRDTWVGAKAQGHQASLASFLANISPISLKVGEGLVELEEPVLSFLAPFIAPMIANMLGGTVDESLFTKSGTVEQRSSAARALVETFMQRLVGDNTDVAQPTDEGAKRVATAGLQAALEGWFLAAVPELVSDLMPFDIGHFSAFTALPEEVISALGIGRLVRRALTPLVNATAATPMLWATNKTYRPKLLAESTALRQFLRGKWDWTDVEEELARQGYTSERIDALLNELGKFFNPTEVNELVQAGKWTADEGLQHLRNAGFDENHANDALQLEGVRRFKTQNDTLFVLGEDAFAAGRIDESTLDAFFNSFAPAPADAALAMERARAKRTLAKRELTSAEALACWKAGVLNAIDYREALLRENYSDAAVEALELLNRGLLDAKKTAAEHKAELAAEKAAAAKVKADAAVAARARIDAARALKAQGSIAELEHAVITGLIPISRLEQSLAPQFDAETVGIYVADVTAKRAAYVALQAKQQAAATRAANKGLDVAQLEFAVYEGTIGMDVFANALTAKGIVGADAQMLTAAVSAKKTDLDAAKALRAAAALRAANKHINIAREEQLVERGIHTMAQYDALLVTLGYEDAARAAMEQLLQAKVDERAKAATIRKTPSLTPSFGGLTLAEMRRAVILGEQTIDQFDTWLTNAKYTADAHAVLVAELRDDVAVAEAARLKRSQGDTTGGPVVVPLTTIAKAARLGVITPAAYSQRLQAGGYSSDDVALELDLLTAEMSKTAANKKTAAGTPPAPGSKGLTLAQLHTAVVAGVASIQDYQAAAAASGLTVDATNTLVAELQDALTVAAAAKLRRATMVAELAAKGVSAPDLEAAVRAGTLTVVAFEAKLQAFGYTAADAQLVGSLLETELAAASGG